MEAKYQYGCNSEEKQQASAENQTPAIQSGASHFPD
jgi:hypothetical protein